jgi:voltage-gated potassium channel
MIRVIRIFRMLRAFRSAKHLMAFLYRNRTRSLVGTAALSAAVLVISSSIAVLAFETDKDSNIKTPFDAVWWAFSTVTTVGYGDRYPVTLEGRLVAIVLMVAGVGLFGVLTGLFARLFLESQWKSDESDLGKLTTEIRLLREKIEQLEQRQSNQSPRPP